MFTFENLVVFHLLFCKIVNIYQKSIMQINFNTSLVYIFVQCELYVFNNLSNPKYVGSELIDKIFVLANHTEFIWSKNR